MRSTGPIKEILLCHFWPCVQCITEPERGFWLTQGFELPSFVTQQRLKDPDLAQALSMFMPGPTAS